MKGVVAAALAAGLLGCRHGEPFVPGVYPPGVPYGSGAVTRLTFNPGADVNPAWLPDGSGVLYSFKRLDRPDGDQCLGRLPDGGGTRTAWCNTRAAGDDSADVFEWPAVSPAGRVVYFRRTGTIQPARLTDLAIVLGTLADPLDGRASRNRPAQVPAGTVRDAVQFRWLSDTDFVYLAVSLPIPLLPTRPYAIVRGRVRGDSLAFEVLANTDTASSVAVDGSDVIYYTVRADSRVFRRVLSADTTMVVHDFGPGNVPGSVQVAGARLAAIVFNEIILVDLPSGMETPVPTDNPAFEVALAPSGRRLVAVLADGGNADLWVMDLP